MTIAELRRLRNKSQAEMAELLGISVMAYREKELGNTRFYLDEARKICKHLNFSLEEIQD